MIYKLERKVQLKSGDVKESTEFTKCVCAAENRAIERLLRIL